MSTIVAQGSLRVLLPLDQLLHNLSTFSSFFKAFSLLFYMKTSLAQEIQALAVKIIGKSFSSASEGLQEAAQPWHWIVDSARFNSCHSKDELGFQMVEGHYKVRSQDLYSLPGRQRSPACYSVFFGLYSQAASLRGFLHSCLLVSYPRTFSVCIWTFLYRWGGEGSLRGTLLTQQQGTGSCRFWGCSYSLNSSLMITILEVENQYLPFW